jgi:hypothetical protein
MQLPKSMDKLVLVYHGPSTYSRSDPIQSQRFGRTILISDRQLGIMENLKLERKEPLQFQFSPFHLNSPYIAQHSFSKIQVSLKMQMSNYLGALSSKKEPILILSITDVTIRLAKWN